MKQQTDSIKYFKVFDKRKHLFGVKIEGQGGWHITPQFEGIGIKDEGTADETVWFKQQGKYGYYHICEGHILIPAMYGCPLFFNANGQAIAWKDYKDTQEKKVRSLLADRQRMMNRSFVHNMENAKRIKRTNDLLMRAIRKAIKLGKKTSKSLQWREEVSHTTHYEIGIYVYPKWKNSKSELGYERKHKSSTKENQRLKAKFDNYEGTHIWNIIAALASGSNYYEPHSCCDYWVSKFSPDDWDEHKITMDDGVSWDEGMHYPVYQDVYLPIHGTAYTIIISSIHLKTYVI